MRITSCSSCRSNAFDVCLCIAVLHHLSTDERRVTGLKELVRIVRPGGLVLVYVWALEQEAKKLKKNQLKELKFDGATDNVKKTQEQDSIKSVTDSLQESSKDNADCETRRHAGCHAGCHAPYEASNQNNKKGLEAARLCVNASRSSFEQQDLFVPWRYRGSVKGKEKDRGSHNTEVSSETPSSKSADPDAGHVYHRYYHVFQEGELRKLCGRLENVTVRDSYYEKGNWCVLLEKV